MKIAFEIQEKIATAMKRRFGPQKAAYEFRKGMWGVTPCCICSDTETGNYIVVAGKVGGNIKVLNVHHQEAR